MLTTSPPVAERADVSFTGHSEAPDSRTVGREAVRAALNGRATAPGDVVILFASAEYDIDALFDAAADEAAPVQVVGCTSTGGFTGETLVPGRQVADTLVAEVAVASSLILVNSGSDWKVLSSAGEDVSRAVEGGPARQLDDRWQRFPLERAGETVGVVAVIDAYAGRPAGAPAA